MLGIFRTKRRIKISTSSEIFFFFFISNKIKKWNQDEEKQKFKRAQRMEAVARTQATLKF